MSGFKAAALPYNEKERIDVLRSYGILDSAPELDFDQLVLIAATICNVPTAFISLVDCDRQWFKSELGLGATETPRDLAFCAHAILEKDLFEIPDTLLDPRFKDHPAVVGGPKFRFYVGAQLITESGFALGTLCVVDSKPRKLSNDQRQSLRALAHQVILLLELRKTKTALAFERANEKHKGKLDLVGELIPGLTHQINNPLVIINGHAMITRTLIKGIGDPLKEIELNKEIDVIENSVKRVARLIRTFRTFSRPENELGPEKMDLAEALKDAVDLTRSKIAHTGVEVTLEGTGPFTVVAKPTLMLHLLLKICTDVLECAEASLEKQLKISLAERLRMVEVNFDYQSKSTKKVELASVGDLLQALHATVNESATNLKISFPLA